MIRRIGVLAVLGGLVFLLPTMVQAAAGPIPGRFVVKLSGRADPASVGQALGDTFRMTPLSRSIPGPTLVRGDLMSAFQIVQAADTSMTLDAVRQLVGDENIELIEPDYYLELFDYPTDALFSWQWGLRNTGQVYWGIERRAGAFNDTLILKSGVAGADMHLDPLYQQPTDQTATVVVAIIDSGADLKHPELAGRFWVNLDEIPDNNRDDDHNGYVDDTLGYDLSGDSPDFFNMAPDNDPTDSVGHGTHVAGIVAANENGVGVVGVSPTSLIMPLKIYPNATSSLGAAAIVYAVINGARVINISWGSPYESFVLNEALQFARENGVFVAIASGNSGNSVPSYPGAAPGAFTVGAGNSVGDVTYFSSYGPHMDIVAPGEDILSLRAAGTDMYADSEEPNVRIIDSAYYLSDGTSMAAPMVAGAAALIWTFRPDASLAELETVLRQGATDLLDPLARGDTLPGFDSLSGYGYLDVWNSLQMLDAGGLYFTSPLTRSRHTDSVVIGIAPIGLYFGGYQLSYSLGLGSTEWTALSSGSALPADSIAYVFSPADGFGFVNVRLEDDAGRESILTFVMSPVNTLHLSGPMPGEELAFAVPVQGSAFGPEFDSLTLSFRSSTGPLERIMASTSEYFDSLIYVWSLSNIATGEYEVLLQGFFADSIMADSVSIMILNSFAEGWPQLLPARPGISPVAADLNNDGFKEVICGTQSGLYVYTYDGVPLAGFPVQPGEDMRSIPAVYDIDRDGFPEIIATGENGLFAFNFDGTPVPGFPHDFPMTFPQAFGYPTPAIAQLGGVVPDSAIVMVSNIGEIRAYNFDGTPYFYSLGGWFANFTSQLTGTAFYANDLVTSADLDGDGVPELVATYSANAPFAGTALFDNRNGLPAFNRASPSVISAYALHGTLLVDLTGDTRPEIITSGYDSTGIETIWATTLGTETLPGWPIRLPELTDWIGSQPTAADLDLDGVPEIICTYFEFDIASLYVFRADGTPYLSLEGRPAGEVFSYPATFGTPMVANVLGDDLPEIIFRSGYIIPTTGPERLFVLDNLGNPLPGWPVNTPSRPSSVFSSSFAPLIDDIDNDGLVELLLLSDDRSILVWDFPASYHNGQNYARINGDNMNSGRFGSPQITTGVGDEESSLPLSVALMPNHPNPFNPSTVIEFALPRQMAVTLDVINVLGQRVVRLVDQPLAAGSHRVVFDGGGLASGIYFYRLQTEDQTISRKMVLVK